MIYFVIPARAGSKGLPNKNRILFDITANTLLQNFGHENVIVTTDDEEIKNKASKVGFKIVDRPALLSNDTSSMRDVLIHTSCEIDMKEDDIIIMLYLTYPERTKKDIEDFINFFLSKCKYSSALCAEKSTDNPYLMIKGSFGEYGNPIIDHDLCRRQDYPQYRNISHYLFACRVGHIPFLKRNLYNEMTKYFDIEKKVDIDTPEDLERYEKMSLHLVR